jgi:anti-sigma B factor antagonist
VIGESLLDIAVAGHGSELELRLEGELEMAALGTLHACVAATDDTCDRVVLDLSGLRFIDASGIGLIALLQQDFEAEGRELALRDPRGEVRRALELSGLAAEVSVEQG